MDEHTHELCEAETNALRQAHEDMQAARRAAMEACERADEMAAQYIGALNFVNRKYGLKGYVPNAEHTELRPMAKEGA